MNRSLIVGLAFAPALLLSLVSAVFAQETGNPTIYSGQVMSTISTKPMPVEGAPYSATIINESVQTLVDGNRIVQTSTGTTARDSQGRTRQDTVLPALGNLSAANAPHLVFIHDPVAQVSYVLNLTEKTAQKLPMPPPPAAAAGGENAAGGLVTANAFFIQAGGVAHIADAAMPPVTIQKTLFGSDQDQVASEDLGSQTMESVVVSGKRITHTIPAGQIGNDKPISTVSEVWSSPDLKTIVLSKRSDPRMGEQTFQLTNIVRAEPDESLFTSHAAQTVFLTQHIDLPSTYGLAWRAQEVRLEPRSVPGVRRILFGVAVISGVFLISLLASRPPAPKSARAPESEFSAVRARAVLDKLVGDGAPHPTGSAANDAIRARILEEFSKLGYAPEVQTGFACDEYGTCATVNNVVARLDGAEPGQSVLLAAHYDSVAAGPGASDDGVGAATVLECARALKTVPAVRHSIIFLIDDGEEAGLIGARVFVNQHRWAKEIAAAVNVDTRGTSGPSLMFETGSANYSIVQLYAKHASFPVTNAFAYFTYKLLPNDTDFTVFKAAGYQGANFAFIGNVTQYHTPLDNFQNSSPASLQHDGDNALPMVLALANGDLSNFPQRESAFFDVFQRWAIYWPASWTLAISIVFTLLLFVEIGWLIYRQRLTIAALVWGIFAWLSILAVTAINAWIINRALTRAGAMQVNWVAHPVAIQAVFWFLALAVVSTVAFAFSRHAGFLSLWAGTWTGWAILSIVAAAYTHGIAYLFPLCLGAAVVSAIPLVFSRTETFHQGLAAGLVPLIVATVAGFELAILVYLALGNHLLMEIAIVVALLLTPFAPFCADLLEVRGLSRIALPTVAIIATVLAALAATVVPAFSAKSPERINVNFWQDGDTGKSVWIVEPESHRLPEPIQLATHFNRQDAGPFPWSTATAFVADAPHQDLAPPTFTILESSEEGPRRTYRALMRSERGAQNVMVFFPPDSGVESARMEDELMQPESERVRSYLNGWTVYDCVTVPAKGVELSFTLPIGKSVVVYTLDQSYLLPAEGGFLVKSRPLTATTSGDGDISLVSRRVELNP